MRTRRPDVQDDCGASLVFVLVFMAFVSLLALSVLDVTRAGFQGTDSVRVARQVNYAADAALETAIARVVADPSGLLGTPGGPACSTTLQAVNGLASTVECLPDGTAGSLVANRPQYAVLTLSTTQPLEVQGSATLGVVGNVHLNHHVTVSTANGNRLDVEGVLRTVAAGGQCTDLTKVTSTLPRSCAVPATPTVSDPLYTSRIGEVGAVVNPLPSCQTWSVADGNGQPKAYKVATFASAKYTQFSSLVTAACNNADVLYFPPGAYYFEDVVIEPGNASIVAGRASGWLAAKTSAPGDGSDCDRSSAGSQFILGGAAELDLTPTGRPSLSICAGPSPANQPAMALYGARSTDGTLKRLSSAPAVATNNKQNMYVHGLIYLPTSSVQLNLQNKTYTYYRGGFVLAHGTFDVSASSKQIDSPVQLPNCSAADPCRTDRRVVFTASVDGVPRIRSLVAFDDDGGGTPAKAHVVSTWSVVG
jgi:hypothetical protein